MTVLPPVPHRKAPTGVLSTRSGRHASERTDRKSTRLNSSHSQISYAVFCLKKKKKKIIQITTLHIIIQLNYIQLHLILRMSYARLHIVVRSRMSSGAHLMNLSVG